MSAEADVHAPDEEGFIPFIHTYCDRWCEACDFVRQCRVGYEELDPVNGGFKQRTMEEALQEMAENMRRTLELLRQQARQHGIDIDAIAEEALQAGADGDDEGEEERAGSLPLPPPATLQHAGPAQARQRHPLVQLAFDYFPRFRQWRQQHADAVKDALLAMARKAELDVEPERQLADAQAVTHAFELLERYSSMLAPKAERAIRGRREGMEDFLDDPLQSDWNGTAKLLGILIDRSLGAWELLFRAAPAIRDDALPLVAMLQQMKALAAREFPDAGSFIRPGFDAPRP